MALARAFCRLLIAGIFVHAGISKIYGWEGVVAWTHTTLDANGLPLDRILGLDDAGFVPLLIGVALFLELFGGILLILGAESTATAMLLTFLIAVTPLMHNPFPGGRWSDKELPSLLRNLALIGALLLLRTTANVKKPKKD